MLLLVINNAWSVVGAPPSTPYQLPTSCWLQGGQQGAVPCRSSVSRNVMRLSHTNVNKTRVVHTTNTRGS